jgi:hypothetical protein
LGPMLQASSRASSQTFRWTAAQYEPPLPSYPPRPRARPGPRRPRALATHRLRRQQIVGYRHFWSRAPRGRAGTIRPLLRMTVPPRRARWVRNVFPTKPSKVAETVATSGKRRTRRLWEETRRHACFAGVGLLHGGALRAARRRALALPNWDRSRAVIGSRNHKLTLAILTADQAI